MNFKELRDSYSTFCYEGFDYTIEQNSIDITYHFSIPDLKSFRPTLSLPYFEHSASAKHIEHLIFNIGLVECISYWKIACPKRLRITAGQLEPTQVQWLENLFVQGLSEFIYTNKIDSPLGEFIEIESSGPRHSSDPSQAPKPRTLVLIGGGKDSATSLEILKGSAIDYSGFALNPKTSFIETAKAAGLSAKIISATRTIDPKLIELNAQGYLNGHTPFSAYLAFLSTAVASLNSYAFVVSSNESSANEENTFYNGIAINHQYSKSFAFEKAFREYESSFLKTGTSYFSFLRPLHEIQIATLFAEASEQHSVFLSCNRGQSRGKWCTTCSKCAFVYLMLYPFISHDEMLLIFGSDLFESIDIQKHLEDNIDPEKVKPLECVGSRDEALLALILSIERRERQQISTPKALLDLMERLEKEVKPGLLHEWNSEHCLPDAFERLLRSKLHSHLSAPVLIYGLGREGKSSLSYLKSNFPKLELIVCDREKPNALEQHFVSEQEFLSKPFLVSELIRSPGIPLHAPVIQTASARGARVGSLSNLFLSQCKGKVIGVTGTKGKSSTSSLLHHILSQTNEDVRLVGNIGNPALDSLESSNEQTIFVYEMSSFQLEDLHTSPSISVLLDIYPEHLDHHQSFEAYVEAKKNIFAFHTASDAVFCSSSSQQYIPEDYKGAFIPSIEGFLAQNCDLKIHPANILAAVSVATFLGCTREEIAAAFSNYNALPHRLEVVGTHQDVTYVNDSLATIPEATCYAIKSLGERLKTLIAGGHDRGISYELLSQAIENSSVTQLILFPSTGKKIVDGFTSSRNDLKCHHVNSMSEAVELAAKLSMPGSVCLLSPASSSLNMFKDYKDRGDQFKLAVSKLSNISGD